MYETTHDIDRRPAVDPRDLSLTMRAIRAFRRLRTMIRREVRIRSEIARLQAVDDHILADIALCRSEIKHAVRGDTEVLARRTGK